MLPEMRNVRTGQYYRYLDHFLLSPLDDCKYFLLYAVDRQMCFNRQTLEIFGSPAFSQAMLLFPLDCSWRLGGVIINHAVDALYLVDNPR